MPLMLPCLIVALAAIDAPPVAAPPSSEPIQVVGNRRYYGAPFISPMGEPFRRKVPHDDPVADWFRQADRNHDGYLTAEEMTQDAMRFFAVLDTNHDGQIDPDELDYYEQEIAPEVGGEPQDLRGPAIATDSSSDPSGPDIASTDPDRSATRITGGGGGDDRSPSGAGRYALLNIPEPVAGADTDLNRIVTQAEFRRAAVRRFNLLDAKHTGRLTLDQLER